jgi:hypothetical protein
MVEAHLDQVSAGSSYLLFLQQRRAADQRAGVVDNLITIIISLFFISAPAPLGLRGGR